MIIHGTAEQRGHAIGNFVGDALIGFGTSAAFSKGATVIDDIAKKADDVPVATNQIDDIIDIDNGINKVDDVATKADDVPAISNEADDLIKVSDEVIEDGADVAKLDELWKSKVDWTGTPHANGTEGHWETITKKVDELVQSPDVDKVYINKGLSNEVTLKGAPNNRPDIMVVKKDGTIDIYEVPSKTDSIEKLIDRSLDNLDVLGEKAGDYFILPIE